MTSYNEIHEIAKDHGRVTHFTRKEGGLWVAMAEYLGDGLPFAVKFEDGTVWDRVVGVRRSQDAPEAYPFLRIAKQYGVDYGDVLIAADYATRPRVTPHTSKAINALPVKVLDEITAASEIQRDIREGRIDWQTGAPIRPAPEPEAPYIAGNQSGYYP